MDPRTGRAGGLVKPSAARLLELIGAFKGRRVVVKLVDAAGEPVTAYSVRADLETAWSGNLLSWEAEEDGDGTYRIAGLPDRESVEIVATIETARGDERYRFEIDPSLPEHEFRLGEPESIDRDESE